VWQAKHGKALEQTARERVFVRAGLKQKRLQAVKLEAL
jgi:hypothetical protein